MSEIVVVTGGAGFIGSHFVEAVFDALPGAEIRILDKLTYAGDLANIPDRCMATDRVKFFHGDVCDPFIVDDCLRDATHIVNFAAETHVTRSISDSSKFVQSDVIGAQVLLTAASRAATKPRFVQISTSEVYGTAESQLMSESHPLNPTSPYAAAKAGADRLAYSYWRTYDLPVVIVRPFNNFGPRQHLEKVIPRFVTSAIEGLPLKVHGEGESRRDFVLVADTCQAVLGLMLAPDHRVVGRAFNVGTGTDISIRQLAEAIVALSGRGALRIESSADRPGQVIRHTADASAVEDVIGWRPSTDIYRGLAEVFAWYADNEAWWRRRWESREVPIRLADGRTVEH